MRKHILFFIFITLFACSKKEYIPEWYINTQNNTSATLYGFGSSENKEQAIQEAVTNLQERIYLTISSKTFTQDSSINGNNLNEYSKNIKINTPKIIIKNYNVDKVEFSNNTYYAMVSISRPSLVESVNDKIQQIDSSITASLQEYYIPQHSIKKISMLNALVNKCNAQNEIENFYNALGYKTVDSPCSTVQEINKNFKTQNTVSIANINESIYTMLVNAFSQKFTINKNSNNIITYQIKNKTTQTSSGTLAGFTINIVQYRIGESFEKNCIGSSSVSEEKAIVNAMQKCLAQSKSMAFEEFFGI